MARKNVWINHHKFAFLQLIKHNISVAKFIIGLIMSGCSDMNLSPNFTETQHIYCV